MQSAAGGPQNHSWMKLIGRSPGFPKTRGSFRRSISERAGQCFGGSLGPLCSGKLRAAWKSSLWSTTGAGRGIGVVAFRCTLNVSKLTVFETLGAGACLIRATNHLTHMVVLGFGNAGREIDLELPHRPSKDCGGAGIARLRARVATSR